MSDYPDRDAVGTVAAEDRRPPTHDHRPTTCPSTTAGAGQLTNVKVPDHAPYEPDVTPFAVDPS